MQFYLTSDVAAVSASFAASPGLHPVDLLLFPGWGESSAARLGAKRQGGLMAGTRSAEAPGCGADLGMCRR